MPRYEFQFRSNDGTDHWACLVVTARDAKHALGRAWKTLRSSRRSRQFGEQTTVECTECRSAQQLLRLY